MTFIKAQTIKFSRKCHFGDSYQGLPLYSGPQSKYNKQITMAIGNMKKNSILTQCRMLYKCCLNVQTHVVFFAVCCMSCFVVFLDSLTTTRHIDIIVYQQQEAFDQVLVRESTQQLLVHISCYINAKIYQCLSLFWEQQCVI